MFSVALIGPDGAGKTTLTARLQESATIPVKCLYMGINIEASNHALPTSRLVAFFKRRKNKESEVCRCVDDSAPGRGNAKRGLGGWLWAIGRLINRLLEEWYRQLLSWFTKLGATRLSMTVISSTTLHSMGSMPRSNQLTSA